MVFALGIYLPLNLTSPILAGGVQMAAKDLTSAI